LGTPSQLRSLAGQEHGRTIPLVVIALRPTQGMIRSLIGFSAFIRPTSIAIAMEAILLPMIKRSLLWASVALGTAALSLCALIT
jgi:hypothetical protein